MNAGQIRRMRFDLRRSVKAQESWVERWFGWWRGTGLTPVDVGQLRWPIGSARDDHDGPATVTQASTQSRQQARREPLTW